MKYLPLLLLLIGCYQYQGLEIIDPELRPYYNQFIYEAEQLGVQLPQKDIVMVLDEARDNLGLCFRSGKQPTCRIEINPLYFDFAEYNLRLEATVFHELAHGLLWRDHVEPEGNEYEESLMTIPKINGRKTYLDGTMREYYIKELFNKL